MQCEVSKAAPDELEVVAPNLPLVADGIARLRGSSTAYAIVPSVPAGYLAARYGSSGPRSDLATDPAGGK
jgi:hypothetical protein